MAETRNIDIDDLYKRSLRRELAEHILTIETQRDFVLDSAYRRAKEIEEKLEEIDND